MSLVSKRHQMKAFSCVVIVAVVVENIGQNIVWTEKNGLVLSRCVNDPKNHISMTLEKGEAWKEIGEGTRMSAIQWNYSKR